MGRAPDAPRPALAMRAAIGAHDWAATPLGGAATWPPALRILVDIMLDSRQPMFIAWGSDQTLLYNDAYGEILARKHPAALGRCFLEVWSEIRADLLPIVEQAYGGTPVHMDDIALMLDRRGYLEEAHFAFSYTPVRDGPGGGVAGFFCACSETTRQVHAERRLRHSEVELRGVLEGMDEAFVLVAHDFRVLRINAEGLRIDGRPREAIVGHHFIEAWPESRTLPVWSLLRRLMVERAAGEITYQRPNDGAGVWLGVRAFPAADGLAIFYRDVSAAMRADAALRESEAMFRALAQAVPNHAWTARPDGALDWFNQQVLTYSGLDTAALSGEGWERIVHPEDLAGAGAAWARALATYEPYEVQFRIRRTDGTYRWHLVRAQPIRAEDGSVVQWVGTNTDIEAQRAATEALAELNADLELRVAERTADRDRIWRNSRDLLVVVGDDGLFRSVNPAWTVILGHDVSEVVGRSLLDFVWPEDAEQASAGLEDAAARDQSSDTATRFMHKDGTPRWISWQTATEDGTVYGYGRHVTAEREQSETLAQTEGQLRQAQKMEAVGQLTGGLAHDFNNLLTGISGSLELLLTRIAQGRTGDLERYVAAAQGATKRASALTHRLLAFSRRQSLEPRPTDVNRLVSGMEDLVRRTVGPAITVEVVAAGGLWSTLIDPGQLESALLNLCINARDAMPQGGRLTVETGNRWLDQHAAAARELEPGQYVTLCVSDNGIGMTPQVIARAFDPFFTTKPIGMGTGLGLSMIYGFVRQSGGQARIYSEVGAGTMVCLYLPRHLGDAVAEDTPTHPQGAVRAGQGETVLVVDDEPTVRMLVCEVLADLGYTALEASDGAAGLRLLGSDVRIDLLVTDVGLPGGINGRQVAEGGQAMRADLKVLFITGYADNAVLSHGHLPPGTEMLTKPFAMDALANRIREMIAGE